MVENPTDKFFLMYLLLEIIVLLVGVHLALNSGVSGLGSGIAQVKIILHEEVGEYHDAESVLCVLVLGHWS